MFIKILHAVYEAYEEVSFCVLIVFKALVVYNVCDLFCGGWSCIYLGFYFCKFYRLQERVCLFNVIDIF